MLKRLLPTTGSGKAGLATLVVGLAAVIYVGWTMFRSPTGTGTPGALTSLEPRDRENGFDVAVPSARRVAGFVESYAPRVEETERDVQKLTLELQARALREKEQEALLRQLEKRLLDREKKEAADRAAGGLPSPAAAAGPEKAFRDAIGLASADPRKTDVPQEPETAARIQKIALNPPPGSLRKETHIPAGSFAEGVMLTGCFAPVEGQAMPIQIRLTSDWTTPNRGRVPLGDAFIVGKAQGDANSERAIIQVEKLSYVHTTGRSIEVGLNGFVADRDGVQGAQGKYVWRAEELLVYAAAAGGAAGAGDALSQSQTTTQVSPVGGATQFITGNLGKFAGGRALSGAASQMNQTIAKRLGEISPAIWVPNGRRVTVVLIDGAKLQNLDPKEIDHEARLAPYSGLDLDR